MLLPTPTPMPATDTLSCRSPSSSSPRQLGTSSGCTSTIAQSPRTSIRLIRCWARPLDIRTASISPIVGGGFQCPVTLRATVDAPLPLNVSAKLYVGGGALSEMGSSACPRRLAPRFFESPQERVPTISRTREESAHDASSDPECLCPKSKAKNDCTCAWSRPNAQNFCLNWLPQNRWRGWLVELKLWKLDGHGVRPPSIAPVGGLAAPLHRPDQAEHVTRPAPPRPLNRAA
mmetsp:Transcript_84601/g.168936  ORF Transcript_84601/g.168936 Transcript_84601/m.168936 type:complete len:232 (-) Transcript_84601:1059-1754(-)